MTTTLTYPTTATLVDNSLLFLRAALIRRGISPTAASKAVARGTDKWLIASMVAQGLTLVHANEYAKEDATMADSAVGDDLDRLCAIWGVSRSSGAGAQGSVLARCDGTVVYPAGLEGVGPNGKRYQVVLTQARANGDPILVVGIDKGKSTNLSAGAELTWTSPPGGSASKAEVGSAGLTNGQDADNDARLRQRLYKRLRQPQNGGSWSHYQQWAEDSSPAVEGAYIFPAAQGPCTVHCAITTEATEENLFSRVADPALVLLVAQALVAEQPEFADVLVTTVQHEALAVALKVTLPEPTVSGGAGGGWVDRAADRWAKAKIGAGNSDGIVLVSSVVDADSFVVNAYNEPVVDSTVCIFDGSALKVLTARVVSYSGSAGAWTINLDRSMPTVSANDYVFPACENAAAYATRVLEFVGRLAPGEKTSNATVLERAFRRPSAQEGASSGITTQLLGELQTKHSELINATFFGLNGLSFSLPLEPSTAASITSPPKVWRANRLAFYPV